MEGLLDVWRQQRRVSEIVVYGRSMEPTIPKGARLVVSHAPESLAPGDVVVFKNRDHLTAHRIVEILDSEDGCRRYVTRGDANEEHDEPIAEPLILGKVLEVRHPVPPAGPGVTPGTEGASRGRCTRGGGARNPGRG